MTAYPSHDLAGCRRAASRVGGVTVLVAALTVGGCGNSGVSQAEPHGCSDPFPASSDYARSPLSDPVTTPTLAVFDNFDGPAGSAPNPDKWVVREGTGWDAGIQDYVADGAVLDGKSNLALRAQRRGSEYTSGRVETRQRASFGYGILTARIKVPSGTGLWPSFWMIGDDEDVNPWPGSGEIDMLEMVSNPRKHYTSLHGPMSETPDDAFLQAQIVGEGDDLSKAFHNYWVIHEENSITVGMDDQTWGTFTPKSLAPTSTWVYNKRFCLILNLSVGGDWAGPPDQSTRFPATMLVDWVSWQPLPGRR